MSMPARSQKPFVPAPALGQSSAAKVQVVGGGPSSH